MRRYWKNKKGSLYFCDDSYTDNELNVRICNVSHCDWTMIRKSALLKFANNLQNNVEQFETRESDYEASPLFGAKKEAEGYCFNLTGSVNMNVSLTFQQVQSVILFLNSHCH